MMISPFQWVRPRRDRLALGVGLAMAMAWAGMARAAASGLEPMNLVVDGVARSALVYRPPTIGAGKVPVVFVFHGHGGGAQQAARSFAMEKAWPQAVVVYPQGLPTPGQLTDPQGARAGWQGRAGMLGDRDLKFFDALLARVKADFPVDAARVYACGHSNGGSFTYLLWLERGPVFAAVAPSSAAAAYAPRLAPKPALIVAGQTDPLVKFAWQERTIEAVRKVDGCAAVGQPWGTGGVIYGSPTGTPVVALIHPGGHRFLPEAPAMMAKFFQEHPAGGR